MNKTYHVLTKDEFNGLSHVFSTYADAVSWAIRNARWTLPEGSWDFKGLCYEYIVPVKHNDLESNHSPFVWHTGN